VNRFALAFRVHNMKTEAGRKKKIEAFVEMLIRGETIYPKRKKEAAHLHLANRVAQICGSVSIYREPEPNTGCKSRAFWKLRLLRGS